MKTQHALLLGACSLLFADALSAHSRWVLPDQTISSNKEAELVSFDFSVSNNIFHPEKPLGGNIPEPAAGKPARPRPQAKFEATLPDGKVVSDIPVTYAGRKSVAFYNMEQAGTYRFSMVFAPMKMTSYEGADGKKARNFGEFTDAKALPAGSKNIEYTESLGRLDTFVSRNGTTATALKPVAAGLDVGITPHPNDLFVGETSEIQVYLNGKPAGKGVKIVLIPGATRHRNERNAIELTTDDKGKASVKWPSAGYFLAEIEHSQPGDAKGSFQQRSSLSLTLEVNPS